MKMINKIAAPICLALASAAVYAGANARPFRLLLSGPVESVVERQTRLAYLGIALC